MDIVLARCMTNIFWDDLSSLIGNSYLQMLRALVPCAWTNSKTNLEPVAFLMNLETVLSLRGLLLPNMLPLFTRTSSFRSRSLPITVTCLHLSNCESKHMYNIECVEMCYNDMSDTHNVLRQLQQVVQQVDSIPQNELQPPIGLLTSEHRETWAKARERAFWQLRSLGNYSNTIYGLYFSGPKIHGKRYHQCQ